MSTPRFLVSRGDLDGALLELRGDELRHLRVRRLSTGAEIILMDGSGQERRGTIGKVTRGCAEIQLHPADPGPAPPRESPLHIELAQAALKTAKLDLVIEKATELGVAALTIFTSSRCVSKPPPSRRERWERIAASAAKQSQRPTVPSIRGPLRFEDIVGAPTPLLRLLFWEGAGPARTALGDLSRFPESVLAVVGPEGGFDPSEVAAASAANFRILGIGPRVLRAETAAIVAVTLCQRVWGDL